MIDLEYLSVAYSIGLTVICSATMLHKLVCVAIHMLHKLRVAMPCMHCIR